MIYSEAEKLAREILADAPTEFGGLTTRGRVQALCNAVLSRSMKREIENAAYERAANLIPDYLGGARAYVRSLIQPPAQKENGE